MSVASDPALETLFMPITTGALAWPVGNVLFLHARDGWPLHRQPLPGLVCETAFRPDADALRRSGITLVNISAPLVDAHGSAIQDTRYPLVLVLPPRQREQARALLARAVGMLAPGGIVLACMANDEGARAGERDLAQLAGPLQTLSKHHCRVYWSAPLHGPVDQALADAWLAADTPRQVAGRFTSRPGVFAWDRIDPASALLAANLPPDLRGRVADLGAGYGYLAMEVLARCPHVTAIDIYEADARALALAKDNLMPFADRVKLGFHWHDVTTGLPFRYDAIVSNPPFHAQGREDRPDLGVAFINAAADAMEPGGRLLLVANRHLPYEACLQARFASGNTLAYQDGFKVIEAVLAGGAITPVQPVAKPREPRRRVDRAENQHLKTRDRTPRRRR